MITETPFRLSSDVPQLPKNQKRLGGAEGTTTMRLGERKKRLEKEFSRKQPSDQCSHHGH